MLIISGKFLKIKIFFKYKNKHKVLVENSEPLSCMTANSSSFSGSKFPTVSVACGNNYNFNNGTYLCTVRN